MGKPNDPSVLFEFELMDRPRLVLRCTHGYVGLATSGTGSLVCNRGTGDVMKIQYEEKSNSYTIRTSTGAAVHIDEKGVLVATQDAQPDEFILQLRKSSHVVIKKKGGEYLLGDNSGIIKTSP